MSLVDVQNRIAMLQAQLGAAPGGILGGGEQGSASGASGALFSSALGDVLATGGADAAGAAGTGGTGAASGGASGGGQQAVELARGYTGVPYLWGGTDPRRGLDCSGLVQLVYHRLGVELPRVAADQARAGTAVPSLAQAQPGDLVFFGSPAHHVGIYAGDGKMIDAPRTGRTVGLHDISGYGAVSSVRRVAPAASPASTAAGTAGTAVAADALALARAQLLSTVGLSSLGPAAGLPTSAGLVPAGSTALTSPTLQRVTDAWEALR